MKAIFLTTAVFLLSAFTATGQNLIKDNELDQADLTNYFVKGASVPGEYGIWVSHNQEADGLATFEIKPDKKDKKRGNVLVCTVDPKLSTWYKAFAAQRVETEVEPTLYRLGFWAKSTDGGEARVFFRLTGENGKDVQRFFITKHLQPSKPHGKYYGASVRMRPSSQWTYYTYDFDFGKVTDSMYAFALGDAQDATPIDLNNFSVCFQNNAGEASTIMIDGVTLEKIIEE